MPSQNANGLAKKKDAVHVAHTKEGAMSEVFTGATTSLLSLSDYPENLTGPPIPSSLVEYSVQTKYLSQARA
jgi:hypothetical protein